MTRTRVHIAIFILIAAGALTVLFLRSGEKKEPVLTIGDTHIKVDLAETEAARQQGLSGRDELEEGEGMLFLFPRPEYYGFWMKDMLFPIDIIWINEKWQVVGVTGNVYPESYPQGFYPPEPAQYVLEVPAGFSTTKAITAGLAATLER